MRTDAISVILVEDDQMLRESLRDYMGLTGFQVTAVGTGAEFQRLVAEQSYDVAVIDINLPDQSGYVLVEYARAHTDMGLVIITAHDSLEARISGYQAGSDLFLAKPVDCRELGAAIKSIAARHKGRANSVVDAGSCWVLNRSRWVLISPAGVETSLTGKEFSLLELLIAASGEVVGREQLLQQIYTSTDESNSRSLDTLVGRLRKKLSLQMQDASIPLMSVYGKGYRFSSCCSIN